MHLPTFVSLLIIFATPMAAAQEVPSAANAPRASTSAPVEPATARMYLMVTSGLGYASMSEQRPDTKLAASASLVSASGLAIQVYGALGYRLSPSIVLGGALSLSAVPSPSIDYKLRGSGTAVIEDGGAVGGVVGPMAAVALSEGFELNAVVGFGGFGRSAPRPGFGGNGFAFSTAATYSPAGSSNLGFVIELRLSGGFFSYQDETDGTYTSTLLQPALMGGFEFR